MEFLVRGATQYGEPGALMAFEETAEDLGANVASLGFDVPGLIRRKMIAIDSVRIEPSEIQETGDYDLEGLFIRLNAMIDAIGAKRVVLDTVEALMGGIPNEGILRAELRRLFRWLKDKGVTAIITGEQGEKSLTRYGLEEYVSDCVIFLEHHLAGQTATRRLRIIKYRGSRHGTNKYPTLIDENGLWVLPITSLGLTHGVSNHRVSSGVARLDDMLNGKGYFQGSSILISGTAGTGKSSLAAAFMEATCRRGDRGMYFSFEESPEPDAGVYDDEWWDSAHGCLRGGVHGGGAGPGATHHGGSQGSGVGDPSTGALNPVGEASVKKKPSVQKRESKPASESWNLRL